MIDHRIFEDLQTKIDEETHVRDVCLLAEAGLTLAQREAGKNES